MSDIVDNNNYSFSSYNNKNNNNIINKNNVYIDSSGDNYSDNESPLKKIRLLNSNSNNNNGANVNYNNNNIHNNCVSKKKWIMKEEEKLLQLYELYNKQGYTTLSAISNKIIEDNEFQNHTLSSISSKLQRLLFFKNHADASNNLTTSTTTTTTTINNNTNTNGLNSNDIKSTSLPSHYIMNRNINGGILFWNKQDADSMMLKYKELKSTTNSSDQIIASLLVKDPQFEKYTASQIFNKISNLKRQKKEKDEEDEEGKKEDEKEIVAAKEIVKEKKEEELDIGIGSRSYLKEYKETIAIQKDTINKQSIEINNLKSKVEFLQQQQQQQQPSPLFSVLQTPPLNNTTVKSESLLPVNEDTQIISSNSAIIFNSSSANQDVYIMFPTVANCESEIKSIETIDGRYHVEIETKNNRINNISHHYIKKFDSNLYENYPIVCKIEYNQVENYNVLLFKRIGTSTSGHDDYDENDQI